MHGRGLDIGGEMFAKLPKTELTCSLSAGNKGFYINIFFLVEWFMDRLPTLFRETLIGEFQTSCLSILICQLMSD